MRKDTQIMNVGRLTVLLLGLACAAGARAGGVEGYTGNSPQSVAAADFNGDGMPDLAVVNFNDDNVAVLLNTTASGSTTLGLAAEQSFATGLRPISVVAADVNGDGKPDLIVANCGDDTVSVLINTTVAGDSTVSFTSAQTFATGATPIFVAAADLNGDGLVDVIAVNTNSTTVSVLLNTTANGSLTAAFDADQEFATGNLPQSVVVADINGDGLPDLAIANYLDNTVSVLVNNTANGSAIANFADQQVFSAGNSPQSVAAGDINGDGLPDLVVVGASDNTVGVLFNTTMASSGTVGFASQQTFTAASYSQSVVIRDVNGDGLPDVIVEDENSNTVAVLANTTSTGSATASFTAEQDFHYGTDGWGFSVAVADMNGDGLPELIAVNTPDGSVSVLLNATAPGDTSLSFLP